MKRLVLMSIPALISVVRKSFWEYAKYFAIPVIAAVITVGCGKTILTNDENGGESQTIEVDESEDVAFCSCFDLENMDKTIPVINSFLASLPNSLNDEKKLQALTSWLKSLSCINDATIFREVFSSFMQKRITEILVSFEEDGLTKETVLDVLMNNPLEATGFHELFYPGQITVVTKTFFTMDMVFDLINSFEHEVLYITGVCYISTMPSDSLLYVAYGIRDKPYVVGLAYALHFMTNKITLNLWLYDMKNNNYQEDWLKTINDYQLVEVMNEERYEGYNIIFNVPEGTERQWEGKFMEYEFVETVRLSYFSHY